MFFNDFGNIIYQESFVSCNTLRLPVMKRTVRRFGNICCIIAATGWQLGT